MKKQKKSVLTDLVIAFVTKAAEKKANANCVGLMYEPKKPKCLEK